MGELRGKSSRELTPVERRPLRGEGARPRVRTTKGCRMTERMRKALQDAQKHPIRRIHDVEHGQPPWPAPSASLNALVRRGYLERTEIRSRQGNRVQLWTITEEGKTALKPPRLVGSERPVFMARGSGTTSERAMAIDDVEVMDAPSEVWLRVSREKRAGAEDPRERARRLARSARRAA